MQRKRLWTLALVLLLAAGVLYLLLSSLTVYAVQTSVIHTTVEDFNPGTFYHTGMTLHDDGEVALLTLGIAGNWTITDAAGLPPVYGHAMVQHNGYVYVIGGRLAGDVLTNGVYFSRINTTTHELAPFTTTTPLPSTVYPNGVFRHTAVVVGDYVYVIGGQTSTTDDNVLSDQVIFARFNADGTLGAWQVAHSLWEKRAIVPAVEANGYIYVVGGAAGAGYATDAILYARPSSTDGQIAEWITATAVSPYPTFGHMVAVYGGRLYMFGGYDTTIPQARPDVYYATPLTTTGDITTGGWFSTTFMPSNVYAGSALVLNGELIALGGIYNFGAFGQSPVGYARAALVDIDSGKIITDDVVPEGWFDSDALTPTRSFHGAVASPDGQYVYVLGGIQSGFDPLPNGVLNIGSTTGQGSKGYARSGWYMGPTIELGSDRKVLNFNWTVNLPSTAVTLTMQYRTQGLTGGWSEWSAPIPPSGTIGTITTTVPFTDTRAFRFQYRALLTTTAQVAYTPYLNRFQLVYDVPAQPDFRKEANPPSGEAVLQGQRITYTLSFTTSDQDLSPIRDALITDTLPGYLTYVPGSITATAGITTDDSLLPELRWYIGTLDPGSKGQVGFVAVISSTAPPGTELINRGRFRSLDTRDVDKFTIHSVKELLPPLLTKTAVPADGAWVLANQTISYTLMVSNPNSALPLNVTITDTLPPSTTFQSGSCAPACTLVDRELRWTVSVASLAQAYVRFGVVVVQEATNGTVIANTGYGVGCVAAAGVCIGSVSSNSTTHHVTDLLPPAIGKQAVPSSGSTVYPGTQIVYTLVYSNPDPVTLTTVTITDTLPPDTQIVAGSCVPPACIANGGTLTWTVGPLSPGQGGQVSFAVLVSEEAISGTAVVNTGYSFGCVASAGKCSGIGASNSTTHMVKVEGVAGQISKSANPPGGPAANQSVAPGSLITYTLTYTNPNSSASLMRVVIKDLLPANTTLVSCVGCITSTSVVSWTFLSVGPNVSGQVQFTVRVNPSAPDETVIQNQASITSDQGRANSNITSHRVLTRYDLQLTKTVNMTATVPGSTFVYGVAYTNSGPLTLTGVVITDYLGFAPQGEGSAPAKPYLVVLDKSPYWQLLIPESPTGRVYWYDVGMLRPNQTGVLTMVVQLYSTVPYTVNLMNNHALITDDGTHGYDSNPSNQAPDVSTPIQGPDLVVTAPQISPGPYGPGKTIAVTATVVNQGLGYAFAWDHSDTATNDWFYVELYARPSSFAQSGPPTGSSDHSGGFCDNEDMTVCMPNASHWRNSFVTWGNPYRYALAPGASTMVTWSVSLAAADVYSLYVQADTGFWQPLDPSYGRVLEYDEMNNVVSLGTISTGKSVYLPLIMRR